MDMIDSSCCINGMVDAQRKHFWGKISGSQGPFFCFSSFLLDYYFFSLKTMAAAGCDPPERIAALQALLRPTYRYQDIQQVVEGILPLDLSVSLQEWELVPGVSTQQVLDTTGVTLNAFCRLFLGQPVWMTAHSYIDISSGHSLHPDLVFEWKLFVDCGDDWRFDVYAARPADAAIACEFLLGLMATATPRHVFFTTYESSRIPMSEASMTEFLTGISSLDKITFRGVDLDRGQCRALATVSRANLEIKLRDCSLVVNNNSNGKTDDDETSRSCVDALVECLQANRGPTELSWCRMDHSILAVGLTGNSRVARLTPRRMPTTASNKNNDDSNNISALLRALGKNLGLVELDLTGGPISTEGWTELCESLGRHPTLKKVKLRLSGPNRRLGQWKSYMLRAEKTNRTRAIANMMRTNIILRTVDLSERERDETIYANEILPCLETNRYRPRVLAVRKTGEPLCRPVLGRALNRVSNNPNLLWLFLLGNVDVAFPAEESDNGERH